MAIYFSRHDFTNFSSSSQFHDLFFPPPSATTTLPAQLTNQWEIQYFNLNSQQLRDGLWKNVVRGRLYVHLPPASDPDDLDAWINTYYVAIDKTGHSFLKQARTTKV